MLLVLTEVDIALLAESFLSRWHPEKQSWVDKNRGKEDLCYSLVIVVKTEQSSPDPSELVLSELMLLLLVLT